MYTVYYESIVGLNIWIFGVELIHSKFNIGVYGENVNLILVILSGEN
jgi:hypothetical protein